MHSKDFKGAGDEGAWEDFMRHFLSDMANEVLFALLYVRNVVRKKEKGAKGILLVRFSHIGDFVIWLDAAKEYRNLYPGETITLLCDK